jgi:hypothetical protein
MDRIRKLVEQWNEEEALWRRYEEIRLALCLTTGGCFLTDDQINDWAWLKAIEERGPLDCIGFALEGSG